MHRRRRIKTHPTTHTRRNHHRISHRTTHTDPIGEIGQAWSQVERNWSLNERHYGALQGLDKKQTTELHGSEQVHAWRLGYATPPPPVDLDSPEHPIIDSRYAPPPARCASSE